MERIEELGWVYHNVGMIIPHNYDNLWSGHFFPFSDSWDELQISFNLCCFGLYKQAFVSLRSGLELGLLSVYYNINDEGHKTVQDWYNSKQTDEANTPRANKIWNILLSNPNIKQFNDKHDLRKKFDQLGYLHNFVHTKGYEYSNRVGTFKSNFQTLEVFILEKWLLSYAEIVSLISTLHLLKYPISVIRYDYGKKFGIDIPSFGGLEEFNINKIAKILPNGYMSDIEAIAIKDPQTQTTINEIIAMPDMTGDEIEDQIISMEKSLIEHGVGFTKWLEQQESNLKLFKMIEFDEAMLNRIDKLRKWAVENNFIEPIDIRLGWDKKYPSKKK